MKRCAGLNACLLLLTFLVLTGCSGNPITKIKGVFIPIAEPDIVKTIGEIFDGSPCPNKIKWLWSYKGPEGGIGEKISVSGTIPRILWKDRHSRYAGFNDLEVDEADIEFTFILYEYQASFGRMRQVEVRPAVIVYLSKDGKALEPVCGQIGGSMVEKGCRKEIDRFEASIFLSYLAECEPLPF